MNSNIVEAFLSRPPYTLYSPSKIRIMMAYYAGTLLTRCSWKRPLTKWSYVVIWNSCSTLSTTSNKVIKVRQVIGRILVCVSIHLECWLDKARVEIITWAAVGVARQQQFSYNLVSKFWQCERDRRGFKLHLMHIGWFRAYTLLWIGLLEI